MICGQTLIVAQAWFSSTTPPAGMTIPLVMLPAWNLHAGRWLKLHVLAWRHAR